jgi:RNA polymerase sigma-70 factor (ECF subfamily)
MQQNALPGAIAMFRDRAAPADPDADVLARVDRGDCKGAVHVLMERHGAAAYRYCHAALHDAALAADVHQQVFVEAFRDLPRFARRSAVRVWLFAIARHRVLDAAKRRRTAQHYLALAAETDAPDPGPSPAESIDDARLRAALAVGLAELPAKVRVAVLLRYQQGFTYTEMAAICGERATALCARVERALPVLRRCIEAHLGPVR